MQKPLSLYFHIPFCKSRCPYCDFYSTTDLALREDYTRALVRAVEGCPAPPGTPVPTVYFGGWTPYLLGDGLLQILEAVRGRFSLLEDCEITLEANPDSAGDWKVLRSLRRAGFDGDVKTGSLMCGQVAGLIHEIRPLRAILEELCAGCGETVRRLAEEV